MNTALNTSRDHIMPVRKIPVNHRVVTGRQALKRLRYSVAFESLLERDFLQLVDFDRDAAAVEGQPVRIPWRDAAGCAHHYTPDFLVTFLPGREQLPLHQPGKRRPWLVEVKHRDDLRENWREYRPRFQAAVAYAHARGWTFHLFTDRRIRTPAWTTPASCCPSCRGTPSTPRNTTGGGRRSWGHWRTPGS